MSVPHGKSLPTYDGCIVCGQRHVNPATMNLKFHTDGEGVFVEFIPSAIYEGYKGVVHGGIISALLDETIGWAVAAQRKKYFVTGELQIRFLRPLRVGTKVTVRGRPVEHRPRYSVAQGEIAGEDGTVYAKATGKFFLMRDKDAYAVRRYLTFQPGDWDFLEEGSNSSRSGPRT
jgi:uncharacterized protein (TIGR00369 family)